MAASFSKPAPRLTVVKGSRQQWGPRLDKFRVKFGLSVRDLVDLLGGRDSPLKKTAAHDLLRGKNSPRMDLVIKPMIAARLREFLREEKKLKRLTIEQEILEIFHEPICQNDQEVKPLLTQRTVLSVEAQKHFGLSRDPFTGDPRNQKEVFTTPYVDQLLAKLEDAINYQHFVALVGDVGQGKTIMRRRIEQSCIDSQGKMRLLWPRFPNMEMVHSGSICSFILREFDEKTPHDRVLRGGRVEKLLATLADQGIRVALGFDECHRLDPRLLTALKNFYEMGTGGFERYLGLILLGQPKFQTVLNYPEFREIAERVEVVQLAFQDKKTPNLGKFAWDYIAHRLKIAGGNPDRLFDREVVNKLAQKANTPQALGNLCNACLVTAHELNDRKVHAGILKANPRIKTALDTEPGIRAARTA